MTSRLARASWGLIGAALLVLPLFPIARWVRAPDPGPNWGDHMAAWAIGLVVVAGFALVAGRLAATVRPRSARWPVLEHRFVLPAVAALFALLAAFAMWDAFAGNPHLIDEVAQLFQARVFAAGKLAAPAPAPPEFFLIAHTQVIDAGWVSQYPPGQAMLLALGMVVGAEWLVNPLLGAVGVVLVYVVANGVYGRRAAMVAALCWAGSTWVLFMSATYMNHVGATTLALAAWAVAFGVRSPGRIHFAAAGLLLAAAALTRPLDGVAASLPLAVWLIARRNWRAPVWLALGALPVAVLWGAMNLKLYGSPVTLGYSALYGPDLRLGFHTDLWGRPFTPLIALSNAAVAVRRLHIYFYEWPIPALLPLGVWAFVAAKRTPGDLVVAAGILAAPIAYFFYWHSGFYPGPRFYYLSAPFLAIGTARALVTTWAAVARQRRYGIRWDVAFGTAVVVVVVWSGTSLVPKRWSAYKSQLVTLRLNPQRTLSDRGVSRALVLVPESWSSRAATGFWALGVPPGLVERAFGKADACELDTLRQRASAGVLERGDVIERLAVLADPAAPTARRVPDWPDPALRLDPARPLTDDCRREMERDLRGFTLFGHLAWRNAVDLRSGIVFARDRYEENEKLLSRYDGWPVWRYAPPAAEPRGQPVLSGPLNVNAPTDGKDANR